VRSGQARARVGAVGRDRAFARLLTDALERADRASPRLRTLDRIAPAFALLVVVIAVVLGVFGGQSPANTLVAGLAAGLSVLVPPARRLAVRDQLAGIIEACRNGVAFRDAEAFVRAASVRTAVFCLRGTLVTASPDTCDVEPIGNNEAATVIALAAGAELGVTHALAAAIQQAARARTLRPLDVRNVSHEPGFGLRGELPNGDEVIVGSRALALRAHVPTAENEERLLELEATGRDVVVVARAGRMIGILTFQYPLRQGALAAVQRLHDIEIDPVLLGGAPRGRLEAIGKAVDIEHVRPEVAPRERGTEVKRIAQSGGPVAVIGRAQHDAIALGAAEVPIALGEAGASPDTPAIALSHEQLVPAVDVLALAQATRARVAATLSVGLAPAVLAALPVAFGLIRPSYAPLAALAASIALGVRDLVAAALPEGGRMEDNR
jgi:cation transport ATPase